MSVLFRKYFWIPTCASGVILGASAADTAGGAVQGSGGDLLAALLRVAGGFALVVALLLGAAWLVKHSAKLRWSRGPTPKLKVLEGRTLAHRQALYVVAYEDRRFLVGSSPSGVQLIAPLPDGPTELEEPAPSPFANVLQAAWSARST